MYRTRDGMLLDEPWIFHRIDFRLSCFRTPSSLRFDMCYFRTCFAFEIFIEIVKILFVPVLTGIPD